jgi:hypothetical protein
MKRITLLALIAVVGAGMFLVSCKAAGGGSARPKKKASAIMDGIVLFQYTPVAGEYTEEVFVAGDFNGWNPADPNYMMEMNDDGVFELEVELDPGQYRFKFVIDGQWPPSMEELADQVSPTISTFVDDGFGGKNAVLEIE